jgi:sirohydrochlorin ferrochelatase
MTDLIAVAHGTADPRGIRVVHDLVREMARQRPDLPISLGFVDLNLPALPELMRRVVADSNESVLVPLLLSSGYHVYVDVAAEAERCPGQVRAAAALGPDPVLAEILADRLGDLSRIDHVVLAAAGSSDARALLDCEEAAALLSHRIDRPVQVGYLSGAGERLPAVLARAPGRVAVATYLLAPGFFETLVRRHARGHLVSAPLGADPRLATLALDRFTCSSTGRVDRRTTRQALVPGVSESFDRTPPVDLHTTRASLPA